MLFWTWQHKIILPITNHKITIHYATKNKYEKEIMSKGYSYFILRHMLSKHPKPG
jgi:hypothetical protein